MNEFFQHFMELTADPAHFAYEVFSTLVIDLLFLGLVWPFVKRCVRREHLRIDREHGVDHKKARRNLEEHVN